MLVDTKYRILRPSGLTRSVLFAHLTLFRYLWKLSENPLEETRPIITTEIFLGLWWSTRAPILVQKSI